MALLYNNTDPPEKIVMDQSTPFTRLCSTVDIINHWVMMIRLPSVTQILTTPGVTASDQYKLIRLNKAFYQIPKVLN